jgi:hypothetical protein
VSGNHSTTPNTERKRRDRLDLFSFPILSPDEIAHFSKRFKTQLFGTPGPNDRLEINPVSGYLSYSKSTLNDPEARDQSNRLPQTEAEALQAALKFVKDKYASFEKDADLQSRVTQLHAAGKPLKKAFAPIPHPDWLKVIEVYPVRNSAKGHADHWLCKFEVELPLPKGKALLLNANLDLRIGVPAVSALPDSYDVVGMVMRYRPLVYAPQGPLELFLEDTGDPQHVEADETDEHASSGGHSHVGNETFISYLLADENSPQLNLLPYEVTLAGGHHLSILPASKQSLWVELQVEVDGGEYKIYALIMGGSGDYDAEWAHWKLFGGMREDGQIVHAKESKSAIAQPFANYPGVAYCELSLPIGILEFGISVYDRVHKNIIHKMHALTLKPVKRQEVAV